MNQDELETIVAICDVALKTRSRDVQDWMQDIERIKDKVEAMLVSPPEAERKEPWLEQYEKGLADGIESAAVVCEKSYGYSTAHDVARNIRSLNRSGRSEQPSPSGDHG